jgi:thioredoxin reductase (NADPH)
MIDAADPIAFPHLSDDQIDRLRPLGSERQVADGTALWATGDRSVPCFVVLSGAVAIVLEQGDSASIVATHQAGQFTGDVDLLSGRSVVVAGRARGDSTVLAIPSEALRSLVVNDSELSDVLIAAFLARRSKLLAEHEGQSLLVVGPDRDEQVHELREFLTRNHQPHTWLRPEEDEALATFLDSMAVGSDDFPVVIDRSGTVHSQVSVGCLADHLGMRTPVASCCHDLVVIGAGPGGLAATVYAASEGLNVVAIDRFGPGGQAGTSSKIENYLGFPTGISGADLAANAVLQATKFGATISVAHEACSLRCTEPGRYEVGVGDDTWFETRSVVIATGARYRRLPIPEAQRFDGRGVYYGATAMESNLCRDREIILVGGGNSAGQAAVFLSRFANRVHLLIRRDSLKATMSDYLIRRIDAAPSIELHTETEITALHGEDELQAVTTVDRRSGDERHWEIGALFLFIGAAPATDWLGDCVALDDKGFIRTGSDLDLPDLVRSGWHLLRHPGFLETSKPGIFAVGDVRSGSTKRVASSVGEGSMAVARVHAYLAEMDELADS